MNEIHRILKKYHNFLLQIINYGKNKNVSIDTYIGAQT